MFALLAFVAFVLGTFAAFGLTTAFTAGEMVEVGLSCLALHFFYPIPLWRERG